MIETREQLVGEYTRALRGYLSDPGEASLQRAYELGRETMAQQLHALDIVSLHQKALGDLIFSQPLDGDITEKSGLCTTFLAECLAPYEMTHRGYREAIATLSQRTAELSQAMDRLEAESMERADVERALQRSEELFRSLIEHASDVISILNIDGTIRYESPSIEKILGYKETELVGRNAFDFVHPEDLAELSSTFRDSILIPNVTVSRVFRFRHKSGDWRILEAVGRNLLKVDSISGILVASRDITEKVSLQKQLHDAARRREEDTRAFALRVQKVQEEERQRIARDLHDDICQRLSAMRITASLLEDTLIPKNVAGKNYIGAIKQQLDQTIGDIRRMSANLRPMSLDLFGLKSSLRMLCEGMRKSCGVNIEFKSIGLCDRRYDAQLEIAAYRIAQEALNNMIKHAEATTATVELFCHDSTVMMVLTDDGRGFRPEEAKGPGTGLDGRGLVFMRERAELLGGAFELETQPGNGTTIRINLPVRQP